jgi:GNAT superfamily N-acetyltransferase
MAEALVGVVKLGPQHDTSFLRSGAPELDDWLDRYGLVNQRSGNATVFVACRGERVVGYYALATGGVEKRVAPEDLRKGGVPHQVPCLVLARLAVDRRDQGLGLGRGLLSDALRRGIRVADEVGFRAFLVHARDDDARAFYEHFGTFSPSPADPLQLFLSIKHARAQLA